MVAIRKMHLGSRPARRIAVGVLRRGLTTQDRLYHGYIDASHSNRAVLMPFHEAAVFQGRVGRDKAKL